MNAKARTLIIVFITVSIVIAISNDLSSIQAILGLISFIMICHFYLNRHQEDIQQILKEYQTDLVKQFGIIEQAQDPLKEKVVVMSGYLNDSVCNNMQQTNGTSCYPQELSVSVTQGAFQGDRYNIEQGKYTPKFEFKDANHMNNRDKLTYLYEDNRISQHLLRNKPLKAIKNQTKMLKNREYFSNIFEDEIRYNIQRSGAWDSENIDDSQFCM